MPESYQSVVTHSMNLGTPNMSLSFVKNKLLQEEERRQKPKNEVKDKACAFVSNTQAKQNWRKPSSSFQ